MKLKAYTVFDAAIEAYARPFFAQTDGEAIRSFSDESVRAGSQINSHPEDYSLWRIGTYDDNTAVLESVTPICLRKAHEVIAASRAVDRSQLSMFDEQVQESN